LHETRYHYDAKDQYPDRFETTTSDGVEMFVGFVGDEIRGEPDDGGGEEIQRGVDERGEDRNGGGEDHDGDFQDQKDGIGKEIYP